MPIRRYGARRDYLPSPLGSIPATSDPLVHSILPPSTYFAFFLVTHLRQPWRGRMCDTEISRGRTRKRTKAFPCADKRR